MKYLNYDYLIFIDTFLLEFINKIKEEDQNSVKIGSYSLDIPLKKHLFFQLSMSTMSNQIKKEYELTLEKENSIYVQESLELFIKEQILKRRRQINLQEIQLVDYLHIHNAYKPILTPYKNRIVYYALHERFLTFLLPILSRIPEEIIVLCENPIPDDLEYDDQIFLIELEFHFLFRHQTSFLKLNFPRFLAFFNMLDLFIELLEPSTIIVIEGNHPQFEMLAIIGKEKNIPVVCLQQGWPGVIVSGFKDMQYSHYLSWGDRFSEMLDAVSPNPKFISVGYPFNVKKYTERNGISFFLQAPIMISNEKAYEALLELAFFCASQFPERPIYIREHPEYPLKSEVVSNVSKHKNIILASPKTSTLSEVFGKSIIAVSIFSSTLVEALVHEVIPFIFNPELMPKYFPDLDVEGLGIEVKSLEQAKSKILELINNPSITKERLKTIAKKKNNYFNSSGETSLELIAKTITDIKKHK